MTYRKKFLFAYLILVIFANPIVGMLDILPDCIASVLVLFLLSEFPYSNDYLEDAKTRFEKLLAVHLAELGWNYLYRFVLFRDQTSMSPTEKPMFLLLSATVFFILRLVFLLPAVDSLFNGLTLERTLRKDADCDTLCVKTAKTAKLYAWVHAICALLPECLVLAQIDFHVGSETIAFDWLSFLPTFRVLTAIVSLAFAAVFLVTGIRFVRAYSGEWLDGGNARMGSDLKKLGRTMSVLALAFAVHIRVDGKTLLPAFLVAAFALLEWFFSTDRKDFRLPLLSVGLAGASVAETVLADSYFDVFYDLEMARIDVDAYRAFLPITVCQALSYIFIVLIFVCFALSAESEIRQNIVAFYDGDAELSEKATKKKQKPYLSRIKTILALGIFTAVFNLADAFLQTEFNSLWWGGAILGTVTVCLYAALCLDYDKETEREKNGHR